MMSNIQIKLAITTALSSILIACGSSSDTTTKNYKETISTDQAVTQIINLSVIPTVDNFQQQTQKLVTDVDTLCADINENNLTAAQSQWKNTAEAWFQYLPFHLGPSNNSPDLIEPEFIFIDSLRLRGINYTDTVRNDLAAEINKSDPIDPATFASKNFQRVGLLAAEVALFERSSDQSQALADIVSDYSANTNKCNALKGYAQQLAKRADNIQQSWKVDYKNSGSSFRDLFLNGTLSTVPNEKDTAADAQLILSTNEYMDYVHKRTIINDAGVLANHSWQLVNTALLSFEKMVEGTTGTTVSFADLMQVNAAGDLTTLRKNISRVKQTIADENEVDFYAATLTLDGNIKRELKNGLGISVGLNFSDGD